MKPAKIQRDNDGRAKLVDGPTLLKMFWSPLCRPSRWKLRNWEIKGIIPFFRIGILRFYDPDEVAAAIGYLIHPKRHLKK